MATQPDIRSQLRSLSIPKDQRPVASAVKRPARGRAGWIILIVILAVAGGSQVYRILPGGSPLLGAASADENVRLHVVTKRTDTGPMPVHTGTGKIVSDHKVRVATKVSGQVVELLFEQGDRVERGQVLARVENVLPRARRNEAAAALEKSRAALAYQRINFERTDRLFKLGSAPEIEYADAKRAVDEAAAQVEQDEAALSWAEQILRDCEVVAPISGVILERNVEVGDFVAAEGGIGAQANAQFGTIADMTKLRVEVDISELDIARIRRDMKCVITPDAYKDRRYNGHVMWIDPGANYSKATVQVKVRIDDPDNHLRVEGVAQVVFLADAGAERTPESNSNAEDAPANSATQSSSDIWIPASACKVSPDGKTGRVFVANDGRLNEQRITVGRRIAGQVEVLAGLSVGQSIAADGLDKLTDGQRIKR